MEPEDLVKHVAFNPSLASFGYSPLAVICSNMEHEGWMLLKVVPNHQYESVAIFMKVVAVKEPEEKEEEETEAGGYM